jgi:DNA-binding transcriptional ArsR family regulator
MSLPAVSFHLRALRNENLVRHRKEGKHVYYQLADEHVENLLSTAQEHAAEELEGAVHE